MLSDYKVSRCTRRCHATDRPLRPGEWYYSVVLEQDGEFLRHDYASESWPGPPPEAIGWWKNRMPTPDQAKRVLAPPKVLIELLQQLEHAPDRAPTRYLLGLMLMRKKLLRRVDPLGSKDSPPGNPKPPLCFEVVADGRRIEIAQCEIDGTQADRLRDELNDLLYCDIPPDLEEPDVDPREVGPADHAGSDPPLDDH